MQHPLYCILMFTDTDLLCKIDKNLTNHNYISKKP